MPDAALSVSSSLTAGAAPLGCVGPDIATTLFAVATVIAAYRQLMATVMILFNLTGVMGSKIGNEKTCHTIDTSFSTD